LFKKNIVNGEEIITEKITLHNISCEEIKNIIKENFGDSLKVSILKKENLIIISGNKNPAAPNKEVLKDFEVGFE
jgi:predicted P-loop ATPase/GTPase